MRDRRPRLVDPIRLDTWKIGPLDRVNPGLNLPHDHELLAGGIVLDGHERDEVLRVAGSSPVTSAGNSDRTSSLLFPSRRRPEICAKQEAAASRLSVYRGDGI